MASPQTLPPLARKYHRAQRDRIAEAVEQIAGRYRLFGTRFDAGWSLIRASVYAEMIAAQLDLFAAAQEFVPTFTEDTDQTVRSTGFVAETAGLVGISGSGEPLTEALDWTPVRAKQAVADGATATEARSTALAWLGQAATTALIDTSRSAELLSMTSHGSPGYVRMVNGGACGRCVVLAGKWFRLNRGFLRHPRCKCVHIPASESISGDWQTNPSAYFDSLNDEQRIKLMGSKANAQAVLDGADPAQVINAYRRGSGMRYAQTSSIESEYGLKFTTAQSTDRSRFYQQQVGLGLRQGRAVAGVNRRLMPESIFANAENHTDALQMLRANGWIRDEDAIAAGRSTLARARYVARNESRRDRRQQERLERLAEMAASFTSARR